MPQCPFNAKISIVNWADTRPAAGTTASSGVTYVGGIWASWLLALRSGKGLSSTPPWSSNTWQLNSTTPTYWRPANTGNLTIPASITGQGLANSGSYVAVAGLFPSRPLLSDPVQIDQCDGTVNYTLTGLAFRNTFGYRRCWQLELLMDGVLDSTTGAAYQRRDWLDMLRLFDHGVTVMLHRASYYSDEYTGATSINSSPSLYLGCPMTIVGKLVDCTSVRWQSDAASEKQVRYKVTMTVKVETPPGRV